MGKVRSSAAAGGKPRVPVPTAEDGNYFKQVWAELKKVVWPTRGELVRMTGIVIATVLIFAAMIGAADYLLGLGAAKVYNPSNAAPVITSPTAAPAAPANTGAPVPAPASTP